MTEEKRIIEVNGVKLEVDLSQCRVVENYSVGQAVKVLVKGGYGENNFKSYPGMVVGFDNFVNRPTIILAYLEHSYGTADIKFVYFNTDTKDIEICPMNSKDLGVEREEIMAVMDAQIAAKKNEMDGLIARKNYFLTEFGKYFTFTSEKAAA